MNPIYLNTYFSHDKNIDNWPVEFGENWTDAENTLADNKLKSYLKSRSNWIKRLTGYSPETGHAEAGWAADISWEDACDIGLEFKQDAIYFVSDNTLTVSYCDERRQQVHVDEFLKRVARLNEK
jgi:hypothetical protein